MRTLSNHPALCGLLIVMSCIAMYMFVLVTG